MPPRTDLDEKTHGIPDGTGEVQIEDLSKLADRLGRWGDEEFRLVEQDYLGEALKAEFTLLHSITRLDTELISSDAIDRQIECKWAVNLTAISQGIPVGIPTKNKTSINITNQ